MVNEIELVKSCIKDDRIAQKELYTLYAGKLYAIALRYTKNEDDAKDMLQESFIKIFKNLVQFRFDCPLESWLRKITVNVCLSFLKKQKAIIEDLNNIYLIPESLINQNLGLSTLQYQDIMNIINNLPNGCRLIFNLSAIEGFKHKEIAEELGVSLGTVKSQYSRAKKLIQDQILEVEPAYAYEYILQ